MGSSPVRFACSLGRSSFLFLSFRKWSGSSGVGSAASSNMPSTRSSPQPWCMSSETSCWAPCSFRPRVIRIDDLGRAEAINYHNLEYKPQDAEAKYFLSEFCNLYYRRNRYTIQDDFSKSLYFLDGKLANGILDAYRKDDIVKRFITNTAAPEIDVDVQKVSLEEMQTPPFRARVDFYMVYYSPADHTELKRDLYTANFVFVFRSQVPNELIPINPLGMTITYFREDQAFK